MVILIQVKEYDKLLIVDELCMIDVVANIDDVVANIDDVVAYIDDVAAYADDDCYYLLLFSMQFDDSYIYILLFFVNSPLLLELPPRGQVQVAMDSQEWLLCRRL